MRENTGAALGPSVAAVLFDALDVPTCPTCGLVLMSWDVDCDSCDGGVL